MLGEVLGKVRAADDFAATTPSHDSVRAATCRQLAIESIAPIYMYFADHNPPHFHAIYAEHEALVRIDDGSMIRGNLPRTAARLVEQWRALHLDELTANWTLAQEPAALSGIDPLQ